MEFFQNKLSKSHMFISRHQLELAEKVNYLWKTGLTNEAWKKRKLAYWPYKTGSNFTYGTLNYFFSTVEHISTLVCLSFLVKNLAFCFFKKI